MNMPLDIETRLVDYVFAGNVAEVLEILQTHPELIHCRGATGTLMHMAAAGGSVRMIEELMKLGLDVNIEDDRERPLRHALANENVDAVAVLLKHGADPNRERAIISAISGLKRRSLEVVKLLEKHGADIHKEFLNEWTNQPMNALSAAIDWGKDDVAAYLRSKGAALPKIKPETPKADGTLSSEIIAYFRENFGEVEKLAIKEVVPTEPSIAVNIIRASEKHPCITLFTTGMSSLPMNVPDHLPQLQYGEVFMQIPADWKPTQLDDPQQAWPVRNLRGFAKLPHQHGSYLAPVSIVPNGAPPKPITPDLKFDTIMSLAENKFTSRNGQLIYFHRLTPLYPEERKLVEQKDIGFLLRAFDKAGVSFVVAKDRKNLGVAP